MKMASLALYIPLLIILLTETHFSVALCNTHADCGDGKYCCVDEEEALYNIWVTECYNYSCLYCSYDSECGHDGQCCVNEGCETHCCKHDYECGEGKFCCKEANVHGSSFKRLYCNNTCLGTLCTQHTDCAWPNNNECCTQGVCSLTSGSCPDECNYHYDCDRKQYCCIGQSNYCNESCPNNYPGYEDQCSLWGNCGQSGNNCCQKESDSMCTRNCTGKICRSDDDCAWPDECCGSKWRCTTTNCPDECEDSWQCTEEGHCCKKRSNKKNICVHECVGEPCELHRDCTLPGECCNTTGFCTRSNHSCRKECRDNWDCHGMVGVHEYGKHEIIYCCFINQMPYRYCKNHCLYKPTTPPPRWQYEKPKPQNEKLKASYPDWETTLITLFVFLVLSIMFVVWRYLKRRGRYITAAQMYM